MTTAIHDSGTMTSAVTSRTTGTATTAATTAANSAATIAPDKAQKTSAKRSIIEGSIAMAMLGASTAVSAHLTHYPVLGGQALRYLLAAVLLFGILHRRNRQDSRGGTPTRPNTRPTPRDWLLITALAITGLVLFNVFVIAALRRTDSATLGSVVACSPLLLAVAGPLFTRTTRSVRLRTALCAATVVAIGSAIVQGFGHGTVTGTLFAVAVLICEALFSLLAVPLLPRLGELRVSAYVTAAAVPILLIAGLATEGRGFLRMPTLGEGAALLYLSLIMTVGAFLLWYRALGGLGPQRAGLLIGFVPVTAAAASAVLGVGVPGPAQLAGVLVGALGIVGGLAFG
jgi:drug/metabolite transporter (DMT)-like permease